MLDPILRAYVEEERDFDQIVSLGFDPEVVRRALALVDRSEYKRRRAQPGIKITARAFGRDRRLPLMSAYRGVPTPYPAAPADGGAEVKHGGPRRAHAGGHAALGTHARWSTWADGAPPAALTPPAPRVELDGSVR